MNGKQLFDTIGYYATQKEAISELAKYNDAPYNLNKITFKEVYDQWSEKHFKTISAGTQAGYKNAIRYCKSIYNVRFSELRSNDLQKVIDDSEKDYSVKYQIRNLFNMMYKYAKKNNIVSEKFNEDLEVGKNIPKYNKKAFTDDDIQKVWENVNKVPFVDTLLIMIYSRNENSRIARSRKCQYTSEREILNRWKEN